MAKKYTRKTNQNRVHQKKRTRKSPGAESEGRFFQIEVRPKKEFVTFRTQDVGEKGHLERIAEQRESGDWDTHTWLVAKDDAYVRADSSLSIVDVRARSVLEQIQGRIKHVKGDVYRAKPLRNTS